MSKLYEYIKMAVHNIMANKGQRKPSLCRKQDPQYFETLYE